LVVASCESERFAVTRRTSTGSSPPCSRSLFFECRQAFRDVAASTNWRPVLKSPAASDIQKLSKHDPAYPQTVPPKISKVLYFYLYAASEHLGSLGALIHDAGGADLAGRAAARCT
jgi:hypothetical protein